LKKSAKTTGLYSNHNFQHRDNSPAQSLPANSRHYRRSPLHSASLLQQRRRRAAAAAATVKLGFEYEKQ
jgi:hypothetical protein